MGIRFFCPNGHKLNVKEFQAGRRGICPFCGAKIQIPTHSTRPSSRSSQSRQRSQSAAGAVEEDDESELPELPMSATPPDEIAVDLAPGPEVAIRPDPHPLRSAPPAVETPAAAGPVVTAPVASAPAVSAPVATEPKPPPAARQPGPPDPISEAPEMIWYVRPPSGGQFGPAAGDIMRGWLAEGHVSADSLVWREGWRDWQEAGKVFPLPRERADGLSGNRPNCPDGKAAAVAAHHRRQEDPQPFRRRPVDCHHCYVGHWRRRSGRCFPLRALRMAMKIQQFLEHHGVASNPFADEDAQTDLVFKGACIRTVFHPTWDKIYGDPTEPATSVVFGEKGSGKTALGLQIVRCLADYNADHPDRQVFVVHTTISIRSWTDFGTDFRAGGAGSIGFWGSGGSGTTWTPCSRWPSPS